MKGKRLPDSAYFSLAMNLLYALGNCVAGFVSLSWWMITLGAYYLILSLCRFFLLLCRRPDFRQEDQRFVARFTGVLFIFLSFCLLGMIVLAVIKDRGKVLHEILMIAMATYAFTKITMAIIGLVKVRKTADPTQKALRNISLVDDGVSIYSLQRSMLVSFPGMTPENIQLFNI